MSESSMQDQLATSYLSGGNASYLEDLYEQFLKDPQAVNPEWRLYFQQLNREAGKSTADVSHAAIRQQLQQQHQKKTRTVTLSGDAGHEQRQAAVNKLVCAYRRYGYLLANTNPLPAEVNPFAVSAPQLDIANYPELSLTDSQTYKTDLVAGGQATVQDIFATLKARYCGTLSMECGFIRNAEERQWLQQHFENPPTLTSEEKRAILKSLVAADGLEKYLAARFVGQKRFSLEGGDSFIPFVHALNEQAAADGVKEVVVGMAHRGRLNILINVFGKPSAELFQEFEGLKDYGLTSGDVKYHIGTAADISTAAGDLHISLAFNPSHLEFVCPVLMGSVSARQQRRNPEDKNAVMAFMVHGDASVIGQGVVMETLSMSQTNAYQIGGSVHLIINNQVGFTVANPADARSSLYCSDVARLIDAPVFHVNGDDPEAVVRAARLAAEYRHQFKKDVFVDLICYRRLGHNEADEPAATQPLMYQFIRQHPTPREIYAEQLIAEKVCTAQEVEEWVKSYFQQLDEGKAVVKTLEDGLARTYAANWKPYLHSSWDAPVDTSVSEHTLIALAKKLEELPAGFELQRQVALVLAGRAKMTAGELPLNWGYAEVLAYATLLDEGYPVRMSGEDCGRGTFAHRHAVLHDQKTGECYTPLQHISDHQASFQIYDSLLSETGAMGFEYGYASTDPKALVIWEAQYGDFANGAQVIIDQFISSAWQKWGTLCGLTLLLPHGYEGDGPEHTSARLERFLQMCAEKNMQVCVPSTPAQMFHLLRRQVKRLYRVPLIVMTPKSLLRHKLAVSTLRDLEEQEFQLVIPEVELTKEKITRLILCSGKVYYDLLSEREAKQIKHIALVRIEQLYPFPRAQVKEQLEAYSHVKEIIWCQEEPRNQGAWFTLRHRLEACLTDGQSLHYVGRASSASPAAGYKKLHVKQQQELVNKALGVV